MCSMKKANAIDYLGVVLGIGPGVSYLYDIYLSHYKEKKIKKKVFKK